MVEKKASIRDSRFASVEDLVEELKALAANKPLKGEDKRRAVQCMISLREMGFTCKQIEEMTGGAWSEATIKAYTRGVKIRDPAPKERTLSLVSRLIESNRTLDDVEAFLSFNESIESAGLTYDYFISFLAQARKQALNIDELTILLKKLKSAELTADQLRMALSIDSDVKQLGVTFSALHEMLGTIKKFGKPDKVMEALKSYADIKAIESDLDGLRSEKSKLESKLKELDDTIRKANERIDTLKKLEAEVKSNLESYERLKKLGFTEEILDEIRKTSGKYGDAKQVLKALGAFESLMDLEHQGSIAEKKKVELETELRRLEIDNAHLTNGVNMCKDLTYGYGFSVSAITGIYKIAKKYGKPHEVLEAMEKYASLDQLKKEIEDATQRKDELESIVKMLEGDVRRLKTVRIELDESISRSLKPISEEFLMAVKTMGEKYNEYLSKAEEVGREKEELASFKQERELIEMLRKVLAGSGEAEKLPMEYVYAMATAILNVCHFKKINPDMIFTEGSTWVHVPLLRVLKSVRDELGGPRT